MAFGHAVGSACIEAHLFAWPDDPIVSAVVCIAGVLMGVMSQDPDRKSFSIVARRLGCPEDATPEEEVEFLRKVDAGALVGVFRTYNDSDASPKLFFRPQVDEDYLFSHDSQLERARQGRFAKVVSWVLFSRNFANPQKPMLVGMTAQEGNALVPYWDMAAGKESAVAAAAKWTSRFEGVIQEVLE